MPTYTHHAAWKRCNIAIFRVRLHCLICLTALHVARTMHTILHSVIYYQFAIVDYAYRSAARWLRTRLAWYANGWAARRGKGSVPGWLGGIMWMCQIDALTGLRQMYAHLRIHDAHLNVRCASQQIYRVRNSHINSFQSARSLLRVPSHQGVFGNGTGSWRWVFGG